MSRTCTNSHPACTDELLARIEKEARPVPTLLTLMLIADGHKRYITPYQVSVPWLLEPNKYECGIACVVFGYAMSAELLGLDLEPHKCAATETPPSYPMGPLPQPSPPPPACCLLLQGCVASHQDAIQRPQPRA